MQLSKNVVVEKFGVGKSVSENSVSENLLRNLRIIYYIIDGKRKYFSKVPLFDRFLKIYLFFISEISK